ncbi:MAG: peptidylprolyl isomerase [Planctomycetes bacterium]|nr:peptidylprolyl isomerase [Planctomycetota bacterium]
MSGTKQITRGLVLVALLGSAIVSAIATGCNGIDLSGLLNLRNPPAIIPTGAPTDSFHWSFMVDLRNYPDASSLAWDFGDGSTVSNLTVNSGRYIAHDFVTAGQFTVRVHLFNNGQVVNGTGPQLIATGSLPVRVLGPNTSPTASFVVSDLRDGNNALVPNGKRFNGSGSRDNDGSISKFDWDFGDGATGEGATVDHTYGSSGRFDVRLVVTDDRGATATTTRNLLVNTPPTAEFDFTVSSVDNLTASFNGQNSFDPDGTITLYSWQFGDNTTGSGIQVQHPYTTPGTYNATLTVTDSLGTTATITKEVRVTGNDVLVTSISPDFAVTDTTTGTITIRGENFMADGLAVTLEGGMNLVFPNAVNLVNSSEITTFFDLTGVPLGDYDVVVEMTGVSPVRLPAAFRIGTANRVRIETRLGDVVIELVPDAPVTTQNFLQYVTDRFYDGTIFHRVVPGFVVQGGGFLPGLIEQTPERPPIVNEFSPNRSNIRGTLAMAKVGGDPNSATSEFFFNLDDNSQNLDNQNGGFTVFANVVEGLDVVDAMAAEPLSGETPVTDIIMTRVRRE